MALVGDTIALRLCLDRLCPPRKDRSVSVKLPAINSAADLPAATGAILDAVASGDLTPGEGSEIGKLLETHIKSLQLREISQRLANVEAKLNARSLIDLAIRESRPRQLAEISDNGLLSAEPK